MSNTDRKFRRRWAREAGVPWAWVQGRRPRPKPKAEPAKFNVVRDDRASRREARRGGFGAALRSLFGFVTRRT